MEDVYANRAASLNGIDTLASWVREKISEVESDKLDVIRFVEIDLPKVFPGIYIEIEADEKMPFQRAFISDERFSIVVSESIYEGASNGCLFSSEVILHEVGHLFLHYKYRSKGLNNASLPYKPRFKNTSTANSAEWQATAFALCMLYPKEKFSPDESDYTLYKRVGATKKQAERIRNHLSRVKWRTRTGRNNKEIRWLKDIINEIKEIGVDTSSWHPKNSSQLSFFR